MQTLEALRRRIASAEDLQSIVKTMKAFAATSIRQYERAVESLTEYHQTTEMGLQVVLRGNGQEPVKASRPVKWVGAIIFGSDQGMCGQFNEQIAAFAMDQLKNLSLSSDGLILLGVGMRVAPRLEEAGLRLENILPVPGSVEGIGGLVQQLLLTLDRWRTQDPVEDIFLYYNRPLASAAYRPTGAQILPLDLERLGKPEDGTKKLSRSLPIYTLERDRLLAALIRQHLFVVLFRACAESLAGENAARLSSMQAAEKNIEERLAELNAAYHDQRQGAITSELLDIVSGFEVLVNE